ncbi:hypothetical protein M3Y97_00204300 [Aphelenchoides bicaudatus]|nr:hypothetical protein M3Y97_00204300 [Aphelenchoides bicaudatus]
MENNKVVDNPPLIENDSYLAVRNGEKFWLFHQQYEDQPDYRHGHQILSAGSSVIDFDIDKNEWNSNGFHESRSFLNKDESQKLDEIALTFANSIFMLLFNRFEGLQIKSLLQFDEQTKEWLTHSEINKVLENSTGDNTFGSKLLLVKGEQSNEGPYLVTKVSTSERTRFLLLQLKIDKQSEVEVLHEVDDLYSVFPAMDPLPFAATCVKQQIYIATAERGCGYRWRTEDLIRFDLETKKLDSVLVDRENPSFGLLMASENFYDSASDSWIFFGSLSKVGGFPLPNGEQSTPETKFYSISQLTSNPNWKQSETALINPNHDDLYVPLDQFVYVISRQHGTLKLPFGAFHTIKSQKEEL